MLNETAPLPAPVFFPMMLIHDVLEEADHSQPASADTETEFTSDPAAEAVTVVGLTAYVQLTGGTASCAIRAVWPPITRAPVRAVPRLEATVKVTDPEPLPVASDVIATHGESVWAAHAQPASVLTLILPLPPDAVNDCAVEDNSNRHGAASWLMRARSPLMRMFPCLAAASGFAATCIWTCPAPWPDEGVRPVIQLASEDAVQVHSAWVLTVTVAVSPLELSGEVGGVSVTPHFVGEGPVDVATVEPQPAVAAANQQANPYRTALRARTRNASGRREKTGPTTPRRIDGVPQVFSAGRASNRMS
jgi:hypothetical protein